MLLCVHQPRAVLGKSLCRLLGGTERLAPVMLTELVLCDACVLYKWAGAVLVLMGTVC